MQRATHMRSQGCDRMPPLGEMHRIIQRIIKQNMVMGPILTNTLTCTCITHEKPRPAKGARFKDYHHLDMYKSISLGTAG